MLNAFSHLRHKFNLSLNHRRSAKQLINCWWATQTMVHMQTKCTRWLVTWMQCLC